jgi:hypothetical protein
MGRARSPELPPDLQRTLRRARQLEWLTVVYMASAVVLLALVLGSSQAMKTAWIEDLLGLIPPVAFLVAIRFNSRADSTLSVRLSPDRLCSAPVLCPGALRYGYLPVS